MLKDGIDLLKLEITTRIALNFKDFLSIFGASCLNWYEAGSQASYQFREPGQVQSLIGLYSNLSMLMK